jgi:hypothetical protein
MHGYLVRVVNAVKQSNQRGETIDNLVRTLPNDDNENYLLENSLNDDPVRNTRPFVRRQKYLVVRYGRGIEGSGTADDIQERPVKR